ncbi:PaaI family thioesterase [Pacificimonas sp. WHA3]|uniref:PaaI family thioesterase n=1 Tax=Pacificimonas pallii TaxID=2827236 RepID=A0ABS6SIJ5_9SPHN|nr:PaaI family thioesterase [Pacificimonas pallii]MBV7257687.1 PaaI family thioesterase [Pacificimonas pallii]
MTNEEVRERMNRFAPPTAAFLKTELLAVDQDAGTVRMAFTVGPELCNPNGSVQGGIVAAMLDDAAAYSAIVFSKRKIFVPTLEMKVSFFAAAKTGRLYADGRCVKFGRTIAFMEADLTDEDGKLLARLSTTSAPRDLPNPKLVERK